MKNSNFKIRRLFQHIQTIQETCLEPRYTKTPTMLSRSLRVVSSRAPVKTVLPSLSRVIVGKSGLRLQSTTTNEIPVDTLKSSNNKTKVNNENNLTSRKYVNYFMRDLSNILEEDFVEFSPYFEKLQQTFQKSSARDISNSYNGMIVTGNKLLTKISNIKKQNNTQVPSSILYKEVISLLIDNHLLHASHFNRYTRALIEEKKYLNALTFWIENANLFKNSKRAFRSLFGKQQTDENDYHLYGLASYLTSLIENKEKKIDPEFIKLIFGESKPASYPQFERFVKSRLAALPSEDAKTILSSYAEFSNLNFDINSEESLKGIRIASVDGKIVYLENTIKKNLESYKGKETEIQSDTLAHYMKYLNNVKLYSRAVELWKFSCEHKIPVNISIWNQLLNSFTHISIANSQNKVESVWKLLNDTVKPNSDSYSIYIRYLLNSGKSEKAKEMLVDLRENQPKLYDSTLKNTMIEYLLSSKKYVEALQLFYIYQKDTSFVPTIEIYNKLLGRLVYDKKFTEANDLLDNLLSSNYEGINPDVATWTTIIDLLMKNARNSDLSKDEVLSKIFNIIKIMNAHNVKFNTVALIVVATNLLKNNSTLDLGLSILQGMEDAGIRLNQVAYTGIITSFSNVGDMDNAIYYYNKALKNGILPGAILYNSILKGYAISNDIEKIKKFMSDIKALINANSQNLRLLPNKYTFYYLLMQGIKSNDHEYVNEVLEDLGRSGTDLGHELPRILSSLKENGYTIPASLDAQIK